MLSLFVNERRDDWDDYLPFVAMAYRSTQHDSTKCSPNLLMFGHEIRCPIDIMFGLPKSQTHLSCPIAYFEWVQEGLKNAFEFAHKQIGISASRQKENYDKNLKIRQFHENTWVWRWYPPEANKKLGLGWIGPYLIIKKLTDLTYKIQKHQNSKAIVVHVDQLKPYLGETEPFNWRTHENSTAECTDNIENETPVDENENSTEIDIHSSKTESIQITEIIKTRSGRISKPKTICSPCT